jgi:hypothetical protein
MEAIWMSSSRPTSILSEIETGQNLSAGALAYFQARTKNAWHSYILAKFVEEERAGRLTKAKLARRIGKSPEVISRLLGGPGNWTADTVSDLLLGICGEEARPDSTPILGRPVRNYRADPRELPEWATSSPEPQALREQGESRLGVEAPAPQRMGLESVLACS